MDPLLKNPLFQRSKKKWIKNIIIYGNVIASQNNL